VTFTMSRRSLAAVLLLGLALVACDKDKDVEPPKKLVAFDAKLAVERVWTAGVGGKDRSLRLALAPVVDGSRVYAAGDTGSVYAFDGGSGRTLWRTPGKLALSGGPGVGSGLVVVGTSDGQVLALSEANGSRRWLVRVSGEVLAAPVISPQAVIVRTVDGRVHGLALDTGAELWSNEQPVPRLSLRGTSRPVLAGDTVVCGFDNGKVAAYGTAKGETLWESAVSPPRGRTELERMVDIDGSLAVSGHDVLVAGFQGRIAMLGLDSGQVWWSRDASSYRGLALSAETLYVSTSDSHVLGLHRRDGTPAWDQDALARRGVTGPALDGDYVVVADFEGQVHWLDPISGAIVGRSATAKGRVTNAPLAANGLVYVQTDAGKLFALRARPKK
jgi:outer membrane protein assembly factor BamB